MSQHQVDFTLADLPTEIHHTIFYYLDYVRDICCDQLLYVPMIEMPSTLEEYERNCIDHGEQEFIDFDHPSRVPFFLACQSLLKSVKSFRPIVLNLTLPSTERGLCRYYLDKLYIETFQRTPWFRRAKPAYHFSSYDWNDAFRALFERMKKLCGGHPLFKVEFVSVACIVGRNYTSFEYAYHGGFNLHKLMDLVPNLKYALFDFNPSLVLYERSESLTIIYASKSDYYHSALGQKKNIYFSSFDYERNPIVPIEKLKGVFPNNYPTNIEIFLYNSIVSNNFKEAKYIINNFTLNANIFSYIWNTKSYMTRELNYYNLTQIMDILHFFYKNYPSFRVFRIPIDNIVCLKLIVSQPFVDIHVGKNITKLFLERMTTKDVQVLSRDYNVDFSKLGNFKFSANCFLETNLQIENTCDIFGVSTAMFRLERGSNIIEKDKFGNNILHYIFLNRRGNNLSQSLSKFSQEEIKLLGKEPNIFGITANELALIKGCDFKIESFNKKFCYESFGRTCGSSDLPRMLLFDGLMVNEQIYCVFMNNLQTSRYDYDQYRDINFRDENGKHLVHYSPNCFSENTECLGLELKDIIFCKDNNQTMPIQTFYNSYLVALDKLGQIENMPKLNFFSYTDNFGMCRYLYLLMNSYINTQLLVSEADTIGFDYSSGQPELVSLCSHYLDGLYHFSIEKSPLKQLKGIRYFGSVDGDDFSHYVLRYYLDYINKNPTYYLDTSTLKVLIARGLKFDVVRNSQGQTAFDLIDHLTGTTQLKHMKKVCRKGRTTKSKALPKFTIKHNPIPKDVLIEDSETTLVVKSQNVAPFRIRIKRSLTFHK
ncbi:predicted protein [Naegleria gruberi]|uniref:Predicted protein n=1 Tax=Naegleria gruberi TaxID=5762 RepID=D2VUT8_NAEGR|nr:uncharacterized protein NAEGRDRAFT_72781 [Naegleria gruberi]EFC39317.1 predicted protein [Naegleria gruberi]|eukprot:XP_002672061.1 predicted protein [Naegleria gruberi strain NEG-M]